MYSPGMGQYDQAKRRKGIRRGRERGCWVYVPAEELEGAGLDPSSDEPPYYRLYSRRRKAGSAPGGSMIQWFREA
jgi:hypothetical protein